MYQRRLIPFVSFIFLLLAVQGFGQYRGRGNPSFLFNMMSGGKDVAVRSEITSSRLGEMFDRMAERMGNTSGKITRKEFDEYMKRRMAERSSVGGGGPPSRGSFDPASFFRRYDKNGDGQLNYDEMSESLRTERDKWDANRDGFIDMDEYTPYFKGRVQQRRDESSSRVRPSSPSTPSKTKKTKPEAKVEEAKPEQPSAELPGWFSQYDNDSDGQLGLYEWKDTERSLDEFYRYDRNNDGFLVSDEVLYSLNKHHGSQAATRRKEKPEQPAKLPRGLPGWFSQYDKDSDGQLGLYEWKDSSRPLDEFYQWDRNQDGFVVASEALRGKSGSTTVSSYPSSVSSPTSSRRPSSRGGWGSYFRRRSR